MKEKDQKREEKNVTRELLKFDRIRDASMGEGRRTKEKGEGGEHMGFYSPLLPL